MGIILQYLNSFASRLCKVHFGAVGASGVNNNKKASHLCDVFLLLLTPDAPAAPKCTLHALTLRCQDTVRIMLFRLTLLDETVETRRPWRGSP